MHRAPNITENYCLKLAGK